MQHTHLFMSMALVSAMAAAQQVYAADEFIVRDIKIDGLVRLTPAQVYSILPIQVGQRVDDASIAEAIRALYATENFDDIKTAHQEGVLGLQVVERPIISNVELKGNKLIPKEALNEGLKKMGLSAGQVLKKSLLQTVESELEQQYMQQGRYDADVKVITTPQANNRVAVTLEFAEGTAAKVVDINIVGNTVFKDEDIKRVFAVKESGWNSIVSRNDRYAREKMAASLEALRALYLNQGYINFEVINSSLNLSKDNKKVFVEVSINEGEQFKFGETKFLGDALYSTTELKALQIYRDGQTYSQERVNSVKQLLQRKYSNAGYYFAEVNVVPQIDKDSRTVGLNYYINPGQQVTVRRVNFSGNVKTSDEVLRREMRQMEGALASSEKIDLSKVRLERTGFFKTVDMKLARVPNVPDQVDINVTVEEQHSGTSTLAVGYSQSGGITFQAGLSQTNFLGTGNSVSIDLSRSETQDYYNLSVTDPYFTIDGVRRGYNMYYRKTKLDDDYNVNNYVTDSLGGGLTLGYPIDENQSISFGLNVDQTDVTTGPYASTYIYDYLEDQGTDSFLTYNINLGWSYNTLNRPIFPTKGTMHRVNAEVALPGGDVDYQKITYETQSYLPLGKNFVLRGYGKLGYGNDLPFYKNFYAGGYGSVRGYENSTLGPKYITQYDAINESQYPHYEEVGGNALLQFGTELAVPLPFKGDWTSQVRPVIFAEGAQVFDTTCDVPNSASDLKRCNDNYDFDLNNLRYSVGVGFTWITMIGPLSLSYAFPLNEKDGDETKNIQFEIGRTF
jgi:outer membrane protein insertion porin family